MKTSQKQLIPGPAGDLEALVSRHADSQKAVVICHPHPLYGGTMNNKVVYTLDRVYAEHGFHTIRFNFRGVGQSHGSYAEGEGEREDLRAVCRWARTHLGEHIHLAGFSFGAYVAAAEAASEHAMSLVTVAPPVTRLYFGNIQEPPCPWVVVQPMADEVIDPQAVLEWYAQLQKPDKYLLTVDQASHFFHGKLVELRRILADVLTELGLTK